MNNTNLKMNNKIIIFISLGMLYLVYQHYNNKVVNNFTNYNKQQFKNDYFPFFLEDTITIEEDTKELLLKVNNNNNLKNKIENKYIEAKKIINNNSDIKKIFIFNHLIDINGDPIYSNNNMSENIIMYNKIKIILILIKILS